MPKPPERETDDDLSGLARLTRIISEFEFGPVTPKPDVPPEIVEEKPSETEASGDPEDLA
jgi:hypothetical protein